MRAKRKAVRIIDRKLGRERAYGLQQPGEITLDPRMRSLKRLGILVHEALHEVFPDWSEGRVNRLAPRIADIIWADRWRRIEK